MAGLQSVSTNLYSVNFRANDNKNSNNVYPYPPRTTQSLTPERQSQLLYEKQLREQQKQKRKSNVSWAVGTAASLVIIALFLPQAVKGIKEAAAKSAAEKKAKTAIEKNMKGGAEKAGGKINMEGCKHIGEFIKFEDVINDKSVGDLKTTKTLQNRIRDLGLNMIEDLKIDAKYVKRAGLGDKGFPRSAVLTGPPGVGKTEFVRMEAKATEAQYARIKLSDFANSYVNGTSVQMTEMFDDIKTLAEKNPDLNFVYLFDEADGICSKLKDISSNQMHLKENRQSFLTGLEEIQKCKNVTTFAATNVEIKELDDAVISRFGRNFEFKLPDKTQLYEGLKFHLSDCEGIKDEKFDFFKNKDADIKRFVQEMFTKKSSFRDLSKIVQDAEARYCRDMAKNKNEKMLFDVKYLREALKDKGVNSAEIGAK